MQNLNRSIFQITFLLGIGWISHWINFPFTSSQDSSDETMCTCSSRLNEDKICDGYLDCPLGTDEIGCFGCDKRSYSCYNNADEYQQSKFASTNNMCYTLVQKCDGNHDCLNGKDEEDCSMLVKFVGLHTVLQKLGICALFVLISFKFSTMEKAKWFIFFARIFKNPSMFPPPNKFSSYFHSICFFCSLFKDIHGAIHGRNSLPQLPWPMVSRVWGSSRVGSERVRIRNGWNLWVSPSIVTLNHTSNSFFGHSLRFKATKPVHFIHFFYFSAHFFFKTRSQITKDWESNVEIARSIHLTDFSWQKPAAFKPSPHNKNLSGKSSHLTQFPHSRQVSTDAVWLGEAEFVQPTKVADSRWNGAQEARRISTNCGRRSVRTAQLAVYCGVVQRRSFPLRRHDFERILGTFIRFCFAFREIVKSDAFIEAERTLNNHLLFNPQIISAAHCASSASNHYYEVHAGLLRRFSYAPEVQIAKVVAVIVNNGFDRRGRLIFPSFSLIFSRFFMHFFPFCSFNLLFFTFLPQKWWTMSHCCGWKSHYRLTAGFVRFACQHLSVSPRNSIRTGWTVHRPETRAQSYVQTTLMNSFQSQNHSNLEIFLLLYRSVGVLYQRKDRVVSWIRFHFTV